MGQRYNDNTKRPKPRDIQLKDLKHLGILLENLAGGLRFKTEHCWGLHTCL